MKTKKSVTIAMLSAVTTLILFSPAALAASSSTSLNLSTPGVIAPPDFGGVITNAGSQQYSITGGVAVADGHIFSTLVSTGSSVNFHFSASVVGLSTSGNGELGVSNGHGKSWGNLQGVSIQINDEVPAATFPLGSDSPTSQIPFFFLGTATVIGQGNHGTSESVPVTIESAYWNPFGGPIVISSLDNGASIFLVLNYTAATIQWSGVEVDGALVGTYGSTPVSGGYTTITNSFENLFAGTEQDSGQISFYGFAIPQLNANGVLRGSTTFTATGGLDCSGSSGLPPGTCLLTGASSAGSFSMHLNQGGKIDGTYATVWSVPSTFTATSVTATVTQH